MNKIVLFLLFGSLVFAGTNPLPVEVGPIVQLQHINKFQQALVGDFVPRNSLGNVGDTAGDLGSTVYRWKNLFAQAITLQQDLTGNAVTLTEPSGIPYPINMRLWNKLPYGQSNVVVGSTGILSFGGPVTSNIVVTSGSNPFGSTLSTPPPTNGTLGTIAFFPGLSSVTFTTIGRPVQIQLASDVSIFNTFSIGGVGNGISGALSTVSGGRAAVIFYVDGAVVAFLPFGTPSGIDVEPCSAFSTVVTPLAAGGHTAGVALTSVDGIGATADCRMVIYEI